MIKFTRGGLVFFSEMAHHKSMMNPISAFFVRNIVIVFFLYGLAFFTMGLALILAYRKTSEFRFAQAILPLAAFGILHGIHEWIEMFQKIAVLVSGHSPTLLEETIRLAVLVGSFLMLLAFGTTLLGAQDVTRWQRYRPLLAMVALWVAGILIVTIIKQPLPDEFIAHADVLARYTLGITGALLGTWALMAQQRTFRESGMPQFGRDLVWCAVALFLYGVIGQFFVRQTTLMPATLINSTLFLQWFGIPVQLFRGVMAAILAYFMVQALKAFELEGQRRLEAANQAKLKAQTAQLEAERRASRETEQLYQELQKREKMLGELLQQVVGAQESERQRIARELHDATGQSLTAISLGLRGIEATVEKGSPIDIRQIRELKIFGTNALGELRQLIADLRPPQLDDLGLVPALQWYIDSFEKRSVIESNLTVTGEQVRLPSEYETIIFRITQEALTNIIKHAHASHVEVTLKMHPTQIQLAIKDDGIGFDSTQVLGLEGQRSGWGLLGIQERTLLLGGQYEIETSPGQGTKIHVTIPLISEVTDVKDKNITG
jgi:signal transduction histidine kinase